jgi:hypothetical protein
MKASLSASVEPLETRIAPATLFQSGLNGTFPGEIDYTDADGGGEDAFYVNTEADPNDPISALVGPGVAGVADTFYAKLSNDSVLKIFNNTGFQPLISGDVLGNAGTTGTIIAFFVDKNLDNEVQLNELTGLSLGNKVKAIVSGSVDGDVVANFNDATGRIGGATETTGAATDLLQNVIADLNIAGDVNGSILGGGQINKLKVNGIAHNVLVGTAANNRTFDFNTGAVADGGDTVVVNAPGAGVKGVSILQTTIGDLTRPNPADPTVPPALIPGVMQAGDGGAGAAGGMLSNITILSDSDGFELRAGHGGAGAKGGAGGAIKTVFVNGLDVGETDLTPNDQILIKSGDGGDATGAGKGGKGGVMQSVFVGFETIVGSSTPKRSVTAMSDQVTVQGGNGGAGAIGGAGAPVKNVSVFAAPTGPQNDIEILGGIGGATNSGAATAKAGKGGALSAITALNPSTDVLAQNSKILLQGGAGGSAGAGGIGAAGGNVTNATLIGFQHDIKGGQGSAGTKGGNGGVVSHIAMTDGAESVRAHNVLLDGGSAGIGLNGKGGKGGAVFDITILNGDLISLDINSTALAGDGGASKRGKGGVGGIVKDLFITELDTANAGVANIRGGNGGAGGDVPPLGGAGGKGGAVTSATISAVQLDLNVTGGSGGNATLTGKGGVGGIVSGLAFSSFKQDDIGGTPVAEVNATVTGGAGGNGAGSAAGGHGGDVKNNNIIVGRAIERFVGGVPTSQVDGGIVSVAAGKGGNGAQGAAGAGGSIAGSSFISFAGDVLAKAGDAGTGAKRGAGGSVLNVAIDVGQNVTVTGGNGAAGGAGGDIKNVGYSRAVEGSAVIGTITANAGAAPIGAVTLRAGDGSGAGTVAGAGGSISDLAGYIGMSGLTSIIAGQGGAVSTKAANGGSIVDASLFGGGADGAEVRIQAGDGGSGGSAKRGGGGGDIRNLGIGVNPFDANDPTNPDNAFAIDPATIVRHIAAGNGGDTGLGSGKGGTGGSVVGLHAFADIGVRSGEAFGFSTMGGLFAGSGGLNTGASHTPTTQAANDGIAGSIIDVTANSIATIVAGRPEIGSVITIQNLAAKVDQVILNGLENPTRVDGNGTFTNFDTANLIGGVKDPAAVGVPYDDGDPQTPPVLHPHANTFDETADPATTEFIDNDNNDSFSLGDATTASTDGFVAAISYINNLTNVRAEAVLTIVNGSPTFIDLNNTNGQQKVAQA